MAQKRSRFPGLEALLKRDFFPDISAKFRSFVLSPLGCLILAAVVALGCGLLLHPRVLTLFAVLASLIVVGVAWPWVATRALAGSLSFDRPRAEEGEAVGVALDVTNHLPAPAWGLAVKGDFRGGDPVAVIARLATVPPRSRAEVLWEFSPGSRGIYPSGPVVLAGGFPFGLWEGRRTVRTRGELIVWPRTYPVGPVPLLDGDEQVEGNVSRNKVGSTGDVLGVRPYRRGDSPRRIHWPQSARHDRLIVCELQTTSRPVVQVILDVDPAVHSGAGPDGSREWAVRVAASLARGWLEAGALVGMIHAADEMPAAGGSAHLGRVMDSLARLPDGPGRPLAELLACPKCRGFRDGVQVVVTTDAADRPHACHGCDRDRLKWVVLRSAGFGGRGHDDGPGAGVWLWLDSPLSVPHALRAGWKEAIHGS